MSVNKYMHPRNIYHQPPNFKKLVQEFPEFGEFVKLDITGKVTLDFKDPRALCALSTILLKKDFGLDVKIPLNKLIPTIPLRLNYILWLEDLLNFTGISEQVKGIDIGTGASCIYPLLAAKKNKWFMLATEVNNDSVTCAKGNVTKNNLENFIKVIQVEAHQSLSDIIGNDTYDFSMCNPPFFSSTQELHPFFKSRKNNRTHPKNAFCANVDEVVSSGGEVEFITKLASDSKALGTNIKIYSTMVGHKSSLPIIKKILRNLEIVSFNETEFCQGNTTRWGVAWTFCDLDLKKVPDPLKQISRNKKVKPALSYVLPISEVNEDTFDKVISSLMVLLKDLEMTWENVTRNKMIHRYFVTAYSNTWSHQRRKKREKRRGNNNSTSPDSSLEERSEDSKCSEQDLSICNDDSEAKSPGKRTHEDSLDGTFKKKLKIESETGAKAEVFFKFAMAVECDKDSLVLELNSTSSDVNRDFLHQILQYIKNNLKIN